MSDRLRDLVSPLVQREPRFLFGAQLVSGLGDWAGRLALAVVVFEKSNSALWTAAVTIVSLVPWMGPGQLLSTFADRFGRVAVMVAADLVRAALFVAMALPLPTAGLLTLAFLAGLCVPPFTSARGAALVDVVRPDRYGKVIALFGVATQAEIVAGYALGGTVIALVGARFTLVLNALTFLVSALLVAAVRHSAASDRHEESSLGVAGVRAGTRVWRRDPICRRALTLFVGVNTMMVLPEALVVPYADELGAPPAAAGLLAATIAVGAMIAMSLSPDHDDHASCFGWPPCGHSCSRSQPRCSSACRSPGCRRSPRSRCSCPAPSTRSPCPPTRWSGPASLAKAERPRCRWRVASSTDLRRCRSRSAERSPSSSDRAGCSSPQPSVRSR